MRNTLALAAAGIICITLVPRAALAHCDTLGSVDPLVKLLSSAVDQGLRQRFAAAAAARTHAAESVEKGREYVEAYVAFMHYAERLLADASTSAFHGESAAHAH